MVLSDTSRFEIDGFSGSLFHPDHADYDTHRKVYNGMVDRRPAVIARCHISDDVVKAVRLAQARNLPASVYGGGHAVTGTAVCDGGVCIDLRGMKRIDVDAAAKTARVEAGANWGEFDAATHVHGLAMTGGRNPTTGVAGLTVGSGSGWLERKMGFVCDNLLKAEVVTADGRKVIASDTENPDLFWGLRGGGGNFGIVTAFHFRLHDLPRAILGGVLIYPAPMAAAVLKNFRDFMQAAPDELSGAVVFTTAPHAPFVPEPARGKPVALVQIVYAGDPEEGARVVAPLRAFGPPVVDALGVLPYPALQAQGGNFPGSQNYWTADFLRELPDDAIEAYAKLALTPIAPESALVMVAGGGAPSRVPDEATAFGMRTAPWNVHYICGWSDPADNARNIERVKATAAVLKPWATGRVYLNYIGDEGQGRIESSFGPEKLARLRALKSKWDPHNFFSHNQNIRPL